MPPLSKLYGSEVGGSSPPLAYPGLPEGLLLLQQQLPSQRSISDTRHFPKRSPPSHPPSPLTPPSNLFLSLSASPLKTSPPPRCPLRLPLKAGVGGGLGTKPELAYGTEAPVPLAHPPATRPDSGPAIVGWWRRRQKETTARSSALSVSPPQRGPSQPRPSAPHPSFSQPIWLKGDFHYQGKRREGKLPKQLCREGCKAGWGWGC